MPASHRCLRSPGLRRPVQIRPHPAPSRGGRLRPRRSRSILQAVRSPAMHRPVASTTTAGHRHGGRRRSSSKPWEW